MLYDKLHRSFFALAVSICGNRYDAEDVLQDTLREIVKSAPAYHGGNVRAWVLAITRNLALRTLQKRREGVDVNNLADTLRYATSKDSLETSEILADRGRSTRNCRRNSAASMTRRRRTTTSIAVISTFKTACSFRKGEKKALLIQTISGGFFAFPLQKRGGCGRIVPHGTGGDR